ncbi:hypothetical protein NEPAR06_0843 [Nematocida parisii]|uniref:Uncharacterized protein n=1 Tax=Nematocida parisii (strain ERTm3) TaxID=935791 RepID=I3EEQ8_NEMP3|nr:uncharacterized protein NEPG_02333 [Nematocida parisii ERTm1]EIJ87705.1 hypothetical protein NEQG_02252 [Nematocida parisii ERTm3]KAI5127710.1 hypothetical protein NEPAR03_1049 [Nematocida parisii]EIJ92934.1 hypothetical protein NEPG_02333 [Nematocida parisii ERTm1]KAI5128881.1 hypothetical protein NEPAR08_1368 [Nematocida parisii]KAI5141550.1 hypothetical protein NEPAR04_1040 [Nematocida parisii]|eukprot:XP_013060160.1 hypothetical protein NEPG_02333 [Nematocida parisii ERTm1]
MKNKLSAALEMKEKRDGAPRENMPSCIVSRSIKQKIRRLFSNEVLAEEELQYLLKIKPIWPIVRAYILINQDRYDFLNLLDAIWE